MFDTVNMLLNFPDFKSELTNRVLSKLSNVHSIYDKYDTNWKIGALKNFRISISGHTCKLHGSIAKYFLNDNLNILTRGDTKRAFEKISDELGLPVCKAKLARFDIAYNFIMDNPAEQYYSHLGYSQNYQRLVQPRSLYYTNSFRTKLFYNKAVELKKRRVEVPPSMLINNLLRYELRYTRGLHKQLKVEEVTPEIITDESFYINIIDRWVSEYMNIEKLNNQILNLWDMKNPKPNDFFNQFLASSFQNMGLDNALELVETLRNHNTFEKTEYYSRLKKKIREIYNSSVVSVQSDLIDELTKKVNYVRKYYR